MAALYPLQILPSETGMQIRRLLNSRKSVRVWRVAAVMCPGTSDYRYLSSAMFSNPEEERGAAGLNCLHPLPAAEQMLPQRSSPPSPFSCWESQLEFKGADGCSQTCCSVVELEPEQRFLRDNFLLSFSGQLGPQLFTSLISLRSRTSPYPT